ncbi:phosphotransferase [Paenibacillus guangzhouensis]|uniref:phosphotransferase n=1 Tax=Paenibacillus guangzhouensis TaxID=1473112 RepID=UPI0012668A31|nr:aminoglycoside phosphotransferase family protein [Paenibacillus guangzhouensis]
MVSTYTRTRIHQITRRFGMIPIHTVSVPSLYRKSAILQVRTNRGTYAVKPFFRSPFLRSSTIHQIKTTAGYMQRLAESGFTYMPHWHRSTSGSLWIMNQGRPFYMTAWIQGRKLEKKEDYEELGRAIATLHQTSRRFIHTNDTVTRKQIRIWQGKDRLFRRRMAVALRMNERRHKWYKHYGKACERLADRAWTMITSPEIAELLAKEVAGPALIHNDITTPNVIISDDGGLFIIDWDYVRIGSIYVDVVKALMNTTQYNPIYILALIKGYEELYPFDKHERKLISALYGLPLEAWQATQIIYRKRSSEMLRIMEQTWILRLKAVDVVDEWANSQ